MELENECGQRYKTCNMFSGTASHIKLLVYQLG